MFRNLLLPWLRCNVCVGYYGVGVVVSIVGIVHPKLVCEMELWGECRVWSYRKTKVAIYLEDLEPYGIVQKKFNKFDV